MGQENNSFGGFSLDDIQVNSTSELDAMGVFVVDDETETTTTNTEEETSTQTTTTTTTVEGEGDNTTTTEVPEEVEEEDNGTPPSAEEELQRIKDGKYAETLKPFSNFLAEQGFLDLKDAEGNPIEIKDYEHLGQVLKQSIDKNRYGELSDTQRRYMEALETGIPQSEFEKTEKVLQRLNSITADTLKESKQTQFDLIYEDYKLKGFTDEKASMFANATMNDEEGALSEAVAIIENAKANTIKEYEALKNKTEEANKMTLESITKLTNETKDVLGIEFTDDLKSKVLKSITTRAGQNKAGIPVNAFDKWKSEQGEKADMILHTLMIYTDNFTKLDKVKGVVKSDAARELDRLLKGGKSTQGKQGIDTETEDGIVYI